MALMLWDLINDGLLEIHASARLELARMQELMEKSRDTPMDMADAALVAAAETLGHHRVFPLDSHFYVYQRNGRDPFDVVP